MNTIVDYLKTLHSTFSLRPEQVTPYSLVSAHGRAFTPSAMPRPEGIHRGESKLCFMNSFKLMDLTDLIYVEGYAIPPTVCVPIHHAWLVDSEGAVIETTWEEPGVEYFGIPFKEKYVVKAAIGSGFYGILHNYNWGDINTCPTEDFLYQGELK